VVAEDYSSPDLDLVFGRNGVKAFAGALRGILEGKGLNEIRQEIESISREELDFNLNPPDRRCVDRDESTGTVLLTQNRVTQENRPQRLT
jgi:hypothetical protein